MKLAKVRHRVMSSFLDLIIFSSLILVSFSSKIPFLVNAIRNPGTSVDSKLIFDFFRLGIVFIIFFILYYVAVPYYYKGQTIGKKVFKLKIVSEDGGEVNIRKLFFREVIAKVFIDYLSLGVTVIASFITMLLREDKKSLSDIIAKTKVIDLFEEE